jgi:hypothetical protein
MMQKKRNASKRKAAKVRRQKKRSGKSPWPGCSGCPGCFECLMLEPEHLWDATAKGKLSVQAAEDFDEIVSSDNSSDDSSDDSVPNLSSQLSTCDKLVCKRDAIYRAAREGRADILEIMLANYLPDSDVHFVRLLALCQGFETLSSSVRNKIHKYLSSKCWCPADDCNGQYDRMTRRSCGVCGVAAYCDNDCLLANYQEHKKICCWYSDARSSEARSMFAAAPAANSAPCNHNDPIKTPKYTNSKSQTSNGDATGALLKLPDLQRDNQAQDLIVRQQCVIDELKRANEAQSDLHIALKLEALKMNTIAINLSVKQQEEKRQELKLLSDKSTSLQKNLDVVSINNKTLSNEISEIRRHMANERKIFESRLALAVQEGESQRLKFEKKVQQLEASKTQQYKAHRLASAATTEQVVAISLELEKLRRQVKSSADLELLKKTKNSSGKMKSWRQGKFEQQQKKNHQESQIHEMRESQILATVLDRNSLLVKEVEVVALAHKEAQAAIEKLSDSIQCSVCLDSKLGAVLQCGHSFCQQCVSALTACPLCREPIILRITMKN